MEKLKLSELKDDVEVSYENSYTVYTAGELKKELLERENENLLSEEWYTINRKRWKPSAKYMVENYLEMESQETYEDFESVAMSDMENGPIDKIQEILDGVFNENNSTGTYWSYEKPIEIDTFPKKSINIIPKIQN